MPHWLIPAIIMTALIAFIVFAFRQGMKVKPSGDKADYGPLGGGGPGPDGHNG